MKEQQSDSDLKFLSGILRIAALFAGAAILLFGCENNIEQIKAFSNSENLPVGEAVNIETIFTDSGEVRFMMKAPQLLQFESENGNYFEFPQGIELVKFDSDKNVISSITADYAKQFIKEKKWEAKNNVIATNAQGDTLKTEHLFWEEKEEKIYTEEFVKIIRTDQIITGVGFQSDQSLENWKIKNPKGTIYVSVDNTGETATDSLEIAPENTETGPPFSGPRPLNNRFPIKK